MASAIPFFRFFKKNIRHNPRSGELCTMKFLVIQTAFIGDVVLATALIEKIHRFFPEADIHFLLRKGNESLLKGHPLVTKTLIWDKKQHKYKKLWEVLWQIRRERYDYLLNCQRFGASGLLTVFSGARHTVGFDKNPFSRWFSRRVPHQMGKGASRFGLPWIHEVDRNLSLLDHLTDTSPEKPKLYPTESDWGTIAPLAAVKPYVCMAPTSVWFTKQWPAGAWVELILKIPADHTIYILGAPGDAEVCDYIAAVSQRDKVVNLAGKIALPASAALMEGAVMNYVNDSAPLHLASAMNAPVTAVFCSTVPEFGFTPLSDNTTIWQTSESLDCRPCGLHGYKACPKGHFKCSNIQIEV